MASRRLPLAFTLIAVSACAPSRVDEAARIINGLTQKAIFDGSVNEELPPLKCGKNEFLYTFESGGQVFWSGTNVTGTTADFSIDFELNVKGDSIFYPKASDDPPSLKCKLLARYAYDPLTLRASGNGQILSCDDFWCEVSGQRISCKDLKANLAKVDCE